jgi:hypothetical protein
MIGKSAAEIVAQLFIELAGLLIIFGRGFLQRNCRFDLLQMRLLVIHQSKNHL